MDKRTVKALEFDRILDMLAERCVTAEGARRARALEPINNVTLIDISLRETSDAACLIEKAGLPPLAVTDGLMDMALLARQGGMLTPEQLGFVARFAVACRRTEDYLNKAETFRVELALNGRAFLPLSDLETEIDGAIRGDMVADGASNALRDARRLIETKTAQLRDKLASLLRAHPEYYSDGYVAERSGRQVLPVKAQYQRMVPGTAVDKSSSGATVFIEPSAAARLREEVEMAYLAEDNEVRRILYALTALVEEACPALDNNARLMEKLDLAFAKGRLGLDMKGVTPEFTQDRSITVTRGRHPLLNAETAVPLSVEITRPISGMVITGPNTGGKTVALKTLGLFALMAQSGLMLPAERAQMCPFDAVLADVGDGQSISENLSTFSAHVTAVLSILTSMTPNSLVLADELGSGTDPAEGMGLAVAVLEELIKKDCLFAVTTHYPEIKEFARSTGAIVNARMKFDSATLRPMYELEMGEAGESCALLIAGRLGMPKGVIARARRAVEGDIACEASPRADGHARFASYEAPKTAPARALTFGRGDSVRVYPSGETAIVVRGADDKGNILVHTRRGKREVPYKRVKLLVKAEMLYPDDYDFAIIFDTVANRKARHVQTKRHDPNAVIVEEPTV